MTSDGLLDDQRCFKMIQVELEKVLDQGNKKPFILYTAESLLNLIDKIIFKRETERNLTGRLYLCARWIKSNLLFFIFKLLYSLFMTETFTSQTVNVFCESPQCERVALVC